MFFSKSNLIAQLREQIAYLLGRLEASEDKAEKMTEIARKALELANEKHSVDIAHGPGWLVCSICGVSQHRRESLMNIPLSLTCIGCTGDVFAKGVRLGGFQKSEPDLSTEYLPNYKVPDVKFCPECNVSVRAEEWPQECPACHCTFGFPET
jgi:rubrerythrin